MLRCVRLKNIVHFQEEQVLKFEKGTCFFIGQNNSGKSTVFEAIRRCMSLSKNGSISSVHNVQEPGIATCIYSMETDGKEEFFASSVILFPEPVFKEIDFKYVKIAYSSKTSSDESRVGIDLIEDGEELVNYELTLSQERKQHIIELFKTCIDACTSDDNQFKIDTFIDGIKKTVTGACNEPNNVAQHCSNQESTPTTCESMLNTFVDEKTVITFALRSICPQQWTNSHRIGPKQTKATYEEVQKRAEILTWYIDKKSTKSVSEDEQKAEKDIFAKLTGRPDFDFERNDENEIVACYGDKRTVSLLKVPEGYYEAKKCSIMLAINSFTTVCFEDPDRGMHPQMVTRLRDLVLPHIGNKVIIIISHNPCFIAANTILKTVFFQRDEKASCFRTISGNQIEIELAKTDTRTAQVKLKSRPESGETVKRRRQTERDTSSTELGGGKDHRIIASAHFSTLFFAKRVMFVEGEGDFLFMEEFRSIVMNKLMDDIFQTIVGDGVDMDLMRQYLCLMQFIPLGGHTKKARFNSVGKAINLERCFLLDYDALIEKEEDKQENVDKFIAEFDLQDTDFTRDTIMNDITQLEKANIFVWKKPEWAKNGTIEQAIIALDLTLKENPLRIFLVKNHVELKFPMAEKEDSPQSSNKTKSKDKKFKLFVHPELTADNISNSVKKIVSIAAEQKRSEINRLVRFMYNLCTTV